MGGHEITCRWIPCEERLPEERPTAFAKLKGTDKWLDTMPFEVIARMPFPEPYGEGKEE